MGIPREGLNNIKIVNTVFIIFKTKNPEKFNMLINLKFLTLRKDNTFLSLTEWLDLWISESLLIFSSEMISILEYFHKSIKIQKNPKENIKNNNKLKYKK